MVGGLFGGHWEERFWFISSEQFFFRIVGLILGQELHTLVYMGVYSRVSLGSLPI